MLRNIKMNMIVFRYLILNSEITRKKTTKSIVCQFCVSNFFRLRMPINASPLKSRGDEKYTLPVFFVNVVFFL